MVGVNVIAADADAEAQRLFTSAQQAFTNAVRGTRRQLPPPIDDIDTFWSPAEKALASQTLTVSAVGSSETVARVMQKFLDITNPDELMITAHIYDHKARLDSFQRVAALCSSLMPIEAKTVV